MLLVVKINIGFLDELVFKNQKNKFKQILRNKLIIMDGFLS